MPRVWPVQAGGLRRGGRLRKAAGFLFLQTTSKIGCFYTFKGGTISRLAAELRPCGRQTTPPGRRESVLPLKARNSTIFSQVCRKRNPAAFRSLPPRRSPPACTGHTRGMETGGKQGARLLRPRRRFQGCRLLKSLRSCRKTRKIWIQSCSLSYSFVPNNH